MEEKQPVGRPPYVPTQKDRDVVIVMAGHNIHQDRIAEALGISAPTLRKHFANEIATASAMVEATLASHQFTRAKGDGPVAQRATEFILNTRFGWTGTQKVDNTHAGPNGGPIQHEEVTDEMRAKALSKFMDKMKK